MTGGNQAGHVRRYAKSAALRFAVRAAALISALAAAILVGYIIVMGVSHVSWEFLTTAPRDGYGGILPMILVTLYIVSLSLVISTPIGIMCAIYLVEYSRADSKFVRVIRIATESLAGIPSILYGLFGMLFFVITLSWSWSLISGALTLSIMVLPTVIRSTEEALKSVPGSYREGSFGLGAGKVRTILRIVLPEALPGILAAVILSVGRIVGETAAVVLTAGTNVGMPPELFESGRTLAVHMYIQAKEGIDFSTAYATAFVLLVIIFTLNLSATRLVNALRKKRNK